jgi:hypothetical protein
VSVFDQWHAREFARYREAVDTKGAPEYLAANRFRIFLPLPPPIIDRDPGDEEQPFRYRLAKPPLFFRSPPDRLPGLKVKTFKGPPIEITRVELDAASKDPVRFWTGQDHGDEA